jgi:hypothetical protein
MGALAPSREMLPGIAAPGQAPERASREQLRRQIARLDRELGRLSTDLPPEPDRSPAASRRLAGGRVLGLAELEIERDRLVGSLMRSRERVERRECNRAAARACLEAMLAEPRRFKFARLPLAALGEPGCGSYQCRPRLGLVGMLAGWWEVKLSSGCP